MKEVCIKNSVFPGFSHASNTDKPWDSQPASNGWNPTSWVFLLKTEAGISHFKTHRYWRHCCHRCRVSSVVTVLIRHRGCRLASVLFLPSPIYAETVVASGLLSCAQCKPVEATLWKVSGKGGEAECLIQRQSKREQMVL